MIKLPPYTSLDLSPLARIAAEGTEALERYKAYLTPLDEKGRYLPYDELFYRIPAHLEPELAWGLLKLSRTSHQRSILEGVGPLAGSHYMLTPGMQRVTSRVDRYTTTAQLELMNSRLGETRHLRYLLKDLTQDEAISSSQLEGAATTTLAAKTMLSRKRKPRTPDERMILGNYKMMKFAWEHRQSDLSPDLILALHRTGVEGIDDTRYHPGHFREHDDVVVEDRDGVVVHQPPDAKGLPKRMQRLCKWANRCHDDADLPEYVHPLVKAMALHFAIGFEHPFRDGNGRVARALFYWFMFRNDYGAFRYISISVLLKKAAAQYGKSYLYSETDDLDLTYFLEHQAGIVSRALDAFLKTYERGVKETQQFSRWLAESGLLEALTDRQVAALNIAQQGMPTALSIEEAAQHLQCSYNTAAAALNELVDLGILTRQKEGRTWFYSMKDRKSIISNWLSREGG
ncbi:MAG: Fic family protein [Alcanivorax sp.]|nr:Fic family protein [Alcanivorax sp.]